MREREIRNFVRGDIWWGIKENAQGSEQSGYRPYIVVSNNSNKIKRYFSIFF